MRMIHFLRLLLVVSDLFHWRIITVKASSSLRGLSSQTSGPEKPIKVYHFENYYRAGVAGLRPNLNDWTDQVNTIVVVDPTDSSNHAMGFSDMHYGAMSTKLGAPEGAKFFSFRILVDVYVRQYQYSNVDEPQVTCTNAVVQHGGDILRDAPPDTSNVVQFDHPGQEDRWFTCFSEATPWAKITVNRKKGGCETGNTPLDKVYYDDFALHETLGFKTLENKISEGGHSVWTMTSL